MSVNDEKIAFLEAKAKTVRRHILEMTARAASGHLECDSILLHMARHVKLSRATVCGFRRRLLQRLAPLLQQSAALA